MSVLNGVDLDNCGHTPAPKEIIDELFFQRIDLPITVFGTLIDCDENSLDTMRQALKYFDDQPLAPNVFELHEGEKCVVWRLPDNSMMPLSKTQLAALLAETEKQKALRTSRLYAKRRHLKDTQSTYSDVMADW